MSYIYLDRNPAGGFQVTVHRGISRPRLWSFADYGEAERFAMSKLGKRTGCVIDSTRVASGAAPTRAAP